MFQRCIVLDIEGTTTPISFVTDVLFPFARNNVSRHLAATYETDETQDDIKLLRTQVRFLFRSFVSMLVAMKYPNLHGSITTCLSLAGNQINGNVDHFISEYAVCLAHVLLRESMCCTFDWCVKAAFISVKSWEVNAFNINWTVHTVDLC